MRFMLIRKADADSEAGLMPGEPLIAAMAAYNASLVQAGVMRAGEGLHPSSRGARIRFTDGRPAVTDCPFAETKELVAGFTMIETDSQADAIEWAKRWPVEDAGGKPSVIDGPFAEAKELIAGFWLVQLPSQADAIAWALRYPYPFAEHAVVEVRKVYEAADFGDAFTPELRAAEERMRDHLLDSGRPLGTEP